MSLKLVTAPTEEPVTLAEMKTHLRVDSTDDDTYITALITAARIEAEKYTSLGFVTQVYDLFLDKWPEDSMILLPKNPATTIASIKYLDSDGTEQTINSADYRLDDASTPARIGLTDGKSWPTALAVINSITIRFTCGYGAAAAVPEDIKSAIKLLASHLYEWREDTTYGTVSKIPMGSRYLLNNYRTARFV